MVTEDLKEIVPEFFVILGVCTVGPGSYFKLVVASGELNLVEEHRLPKGSATTVFGGLLLANDVIIHILDLNVESRDTPDLSTSYSEVVVLWAQITD